MTTFSLPLDLADRQRRLRYLIAGWAGAALLVLAQGVAEQAVGLGTVSLEFLLRWRLFPVALWAGATPLVLAAARGWPLGGRWRRDLAAHAVGFGAWMVLSNALLRLPDLLAGRGIAHETIDAAIRYAPAGALLWAGLVLLGRTGWKEPASDREEGVARPPAAEQEDAPRPAAATAEPADPATGGDRRSATRDPLALREADRTWLVPRRAVRWVEADGDYLRVHTDDRVYRVRGPLKALHRELGDDAFLRIHRSTLVRMGFIREVQPLFHGDWVAILRDGTKLRIPRSRRAALRRLRGVER